RIRLSPGARGNTARTVTNRGALLASSFPLPPADPHTILRRMGKSESDVRLFRSGASVFVSIT
ncbi:MAG: hypothetical protein II779_10310, partial [Clostridia bacterium]|nr:hypothetical protein [Clostridia bacterium]